MSGRNIDTDVRDSPDSGRLKIFLVHPPARGQFERRHDVRLVEHPELEHLVIPIELEKCYPHITLEHASSEEACRAFLNDARGCCFFGLQQEFEVQRFYNNAHKLKYSDQFMEQFA